MKETGTSILIFGGTTEGRIAAERLLAEGVPCTVSVATCYGEEVMHPHPLMTVHTGRLNRSRMGQMMREGDFSCVIDATHPYARIVSDEIRAACGDAGLPCLRLQRQESSRESVGASGLAEPVGPADHAGSGARRAESVGPAEKSGGERPGRPERQETCVYVSDVDEAAAFLGTVPGRILVTTGSKEIVRFAKALGSPERIAARVLPTAESLRACAEAGLAGRQIFAMQGPFDLEMNCAQIHHSGAKWLLTKESGTAGGYPQKIQAARKCGIRAVVIRRPGGAESMATDTVQVLGLEETIAAALRYAAQADGRVKENQPPAIGEKDIKTRREKAPRTTLFLVGTGPGTPEAATEEAREAIGAAELLFGAQPVLDKLTGTWKSAAGKPAVPIYDSRGILQYLEDHPQIRTAAVAYSGDSGFYSGAASMLAKGKDLGEGRSRFELRVVCGISSLSWFAARAGIPWQGWKILSSHGRFCNVTGQVRRNRECFLLLAGVEDLRKTGALLADAQERGLTGPLTLIYGYELSRPGEEIRSCTARELAQVTREGLYVLYIRNDEAEKAPVLPGMPDGAFLRGKAPMTSSEIRALSLCRLGLTANAVLWDVGAGTGSVSVEAALACPDARVWSVECKEEALALLEKNREKFCLQNMEIIRGRAPQALEDLPAPTHVFIGGSGGEIRQILDLVLTKNQEAKVVVNCITSETLAALQAALKDLPVRDIRCAQVLVNREEMLGRYHYLRAGNPVFIISFAGTGNRGRT